MSSHSSPSPRQDRDKLQRSFTGYDDDQSKAKEIGKTSASEPNSGRQSPSEKTEEPSDEQKRTLWVGGIADKVDEEILYEMFMNAGPLESVKIPVDRETKRQKPFAFILYRFPESVTYAIDLFRDVRLFGRTLRMQNKATGAGMNNGHTQNANPSRSFNHHRSFSAPIPVNSIVQTQTQAHLQMFQQQQFSAWMPNMPPPPGPLVLPNGMMNPFATDTLQQAGNPRYPDQFDSRWNARHHDDYRSNQRSRDRQSDRRDRRDAPYDQWDRDRRRSNDYDRSRHRGYESKGRRR